MEIESTKWSFQRIQDTNKATEEATLTPRLATYMLMDNLNPNDPRPLIPIGNGDPSLFPCFKPAAGAQDAILNTFQSGNHNFYPPPPGIPPARKAIAEFLSRDLPYKLSPDDVYVTVGCAQAMKISLEAVCRPGANILLPKPGFLGYDAYASHMNLEIRHYDLLPELGWEIDLDLVEAIADENTVAIVIINPGACGSVFSYKYLEKIAETARKLGILIIADEVYGHISFGSTKYVPMGVFASIVPVLTLGSLSKRWMVPGWRLGWLVVNDPHRILNQTGMVESIKRVVNVSNEPATFIQGAIPQIIENTEEDFFTKTVGILREAADICYNGIKEIPCMTLHNKPEGGMFVLVKLNMSMLEDISDDVEFCIKLVREESVIVIPGKAVGMKNWIRIFFACDLSLLVDGLVRIKAFCERHTKNH